MTPAIPVLDDVSRLVEERGARGRAAVLRVLRGTAPVGRVVAVLGMAGAGRSTVAAQLACAAAAHHPGPVVVVDGSGSVWPGLVRRLPAEPGCVPDWPDFGALLAEPDPVPTLRAFVHSARQDVGDTGVLGRVVRLGGIAPARRFEPLAPSSLLAAVELCRSVCRLTIVDCPAEAHVLARVCETAADALLVVCRADASELLRCGSLLDLLARDTDRDVHGRAVVVAVGHRPGRWPKRAAAAEAAAGGAAVAVVRMPYDAVLAEADSPVAHGGEAAERITAVCAVVAEQRRY
ncbi:hypothetical protein [Saccharothrix variisporea]|uniref:hypothetical protein n=1 Tax=Saccharothrix variisporea TaxID=543527 RepID=UPI000EB3E3B5|nr:hypothetical protein [Saccharothrix variisporea]